MFGNGDDSTLIVVAVSVEYRQPVTCSLQYPGEVVTGTVIKIAPLVNRQGRDE